MKISLPTDPRTLAPPGKSICVVADTIIVIDDGGGECITSFSDDEAVAIFLEWLDHKREQRTHEQAEAFHQYQVKQRRESLRAVQRHSDEKK